MKTNALSDAAVSQAALARTATGRDVSFFANDMQQEEAQLRDMLAGARILAIGAAGSIGSSTVRVMADFDPAALHVVDQNENELAELVRSLRSRPQGLSIADFRALPLDYGSPAFVGLLAAEGPYDIVLNFAAIKHVRSEKDSFSTLQMFDTNLRKQAKLLALLDRSSFCGRYFSVSTDKAANPSSMMGASKRAMEHVMFADELGSDARRFAVTSARFANVAFSNGSLLQAFQRRLEAGEPLAVPRDTHRYFVSLQESGEICTLGALIPPTGSIVVPRLDPQEHLVMLENVVRSFLTHHGLKAEIYDDESAARMGVAEARSRGCWPLLLTPLDTVGEKPYEEFVGEGEKVTEIGLPNLGAVNYRPAPAGSVRRLVDELEIIFSSSLADTGKDTLRDMLARLEPAFAKTHRMSGKNLDERI